MGKSRLLWLAIILYVLVLCCYAIWSYSLTDPNLVLTTWSPYWQFQQYVWQHVYAYSQVLSRLYLVLLCSLFSLYALVLVVAMKKRRTLKWGFKKSVICLLVLSIPLIFSNNALSHDIFNYIFNARMVVLYHENPHVQVALDFAQDPWTRFMHNTHTPAPYWYGWTGLSVVPYILGMGKFTLTWFLFKSFSVVSLLSLLGSWFVWARWRGVSIPVWAMLFVICNPLILIEIISNAHNDLWMLFPAVLALAVVLYKKLNWKFVLLSLVLLLFSAAIKYVTLLLVPLWMLIIFIRAALQITKYRKPSQKLEKIQHIEFDQSTSYLPQSLGFLEKHTPLIASMILFLPLFSERSKQFLSWYLIWSLVWVPLFHWKASRSTQPDVANKIVQIVTLLWTALLLGFTLSALVRYVPWLRAGEFNILVLQQQAILLWGGGIILGVIIGLCAIMYLWKRE